MFRNPSYRTRLVVSLLVAGLTLSCGVQAVVNVGVVPNAAQTAFNLAAGGVTAAINVPTADKPVFLQGVTTTVGDRGIGNVSILRASAAPAFLMWAGLNSHTPATVAQGFSAVAGTDIVFIDFAHDVVIEVASASQVRVRNTSAGPRAGALLFLF